MFSYLHQTFRAWARSGTRAGAPEVRSRLQCEALEDRTLLSLTGAQLFAAGLPAADHAVLARYPGGRSVVAWTTQNSPTNHDVKAQVFDAAGHKVGGVLTVAGGPQNQFSPSVAVNAKGDFVVTWVSGSPTANEDVHAALFRANLSRVRNATVADTPLREYDPSVGIDARDDFAVSYTVQAKGSNTDVKAVLFNPAALPVRGITVAATSAAEGHSHVAMNPDGSFAVSYVSNGSTHVKHYTRAGLPVPVPAPPPPLSLHGLLAGGYAADPAGPAGTVRYDVAAIGSLSGLGQVMVSGDLLAATSTHTGPAAGELTLHAAGGTLTLDLTRPRPGAFAPLPPQLDFTVESGTGSLAHLHGSGLVGVHLFPSSHTLTFDFEPRAA
jgi:hypothetical protein